MYSSYPIECRGVKESKSEFEMQSDADAPAVNRRSGNYHLKTEGARNVM